MQQEHVIIAGGSGLIGERLTQMLLEKGYCVSWFSRSTGIKASFRVYHWDPGNGIIQREGLVEGVHIVNLAGENIGSGRWTEDKKKRLTGSRIEGANLFFQTLKDLPGKAKSYVSPSSVGYYGNRNGEVLTERSAPSEDFLGRLSRQWEAAARQMEELGIRTVCIRTGMVLSPAGGALPKLAAVAKRGLGAAFGSGEQWVSWIHLDDICRLYIAAIGDENMRGIYNGVAPDPVSNRELVTEIARVFGKRRWLPNIPAFALELALGEMHHTLTDSARVSAAKVLDAGFRFDFPKLRPALEELYR